MFSIPRRLRSVNAMLTALALVAGGLAYWGASHYVRARAALVERQLHRDYVAERIAVAAHDLPAGKSLEMRDMAARAVPVRFAPSDRVTAERASALVGLRTSHAVRRGDPLGWTDVESRDSSTLSARLHVGQRAITFPVDDVNSFSGMLTPGDTIDLLHVTRSDARSAQVVPLLQSVQVLATGKLLRRHRVQDAGGSEREVSSEFVTVTLHVAPDDAARIVLAQQTGELTAVLRNAMDRGSLRFTRMDSRALLAAPAAGTTLPVGAGGAFFELIVGGNGATVGQVRRVPILKLPADRWGHDEVRR